MRGEEGFVPLTLNPMADFWPEAMKRPSLDTAKQVTSSVCPCKNACVFFLVLRITMVDPNG